MASAWTDFDQAAVSSLFFLGHTPGQPAQPIAYARKADDRAHLAYYGTTRSGKTYAIEYALQQLVRDRSAGFCYVDPHGPGYWRMASYLRQHDITERVLFWDTNDPEYVVTYDPFDVPNQSAAYIADNLTAALLATLGRSADAHEQPLLKSVTDAGLMALLSLGLPFPLAGHLFNPGETVIKEAIASRLPDSNVLKTISRLPRFQERYQELAAPYRRLDNLFRHDQLRLSFAASGVNFRALMDEGWIVLVNTAPRRQTDDAAILFTRLLVKSLFLAAKDRDAADDPAPFFLAIDEASRYLTTDTAHILAQTAKFGLYLLLGMQSMEQARDENPETYLAIRTCVNSEAVLRLSDYDEKLYFARRFFGDYFDFTSIKHEQVQTIAIPYSVFPYDTRTVYEHEQLRTPTFFTPDELERLHAQRFGLRLPGAGRRFGIARVNEMPPTEIEVPQLAPPMYSEEEMVHYLREFKKQQPATLPLLEAERRYTELIDRHVLELTGLKHDPYKAARTPRRGAKTTPKE